MLSRMATKAEESWYARVSSNGGASAALNASSITKYFSGADYRSVSDWGIAR
jgi:hypothetical protein